MMAELDLTGKLEKMQREWDDRARENARFYVDTHHQNWTDEDFFRSGEVTVREEILTDMINICQGKDPKQMTVLEIGCGAGRVTRALARVFGQVYGVDISGEMIRQAKAALAGVPNAHVFQNNGKDLDVLGDTRFDFAFSSIVFQHIPSREVIESYARAVQKRLRTGRLFKFQVQGAQGLYHPPDDTWLGVAFSEIDARGMALRCQFEMRFTYGAGTQYFWLWFFKLPYLTGTARVLAADIRRLRDRVTNKARAIER